MWGLGEKKTEGEETASKGPWGSQLNEAVADVRKVGAGSKARAKEAETKSGSGLSSKDAEKLSKLFEPEKWEPLVAAPFNLMAVKTGRECNRLTDKQRKTLAEVTAPCGEHFMVLEPKYFVLGMAIMTWGMTIAEKISENAAAARAEAKFNQPDDKSTPGIQLVSP